MPPQPPTRRPDERDVSGGRGPGPVPVDPVIAAVRPQRCRLGERPARLPGAPELHQRAAQAEQRVVVGRRPLDDRLELLTRALELVRAEVGTPERLADRRLVGLEVAGLGERDRRLVEMPVLEQLRPLLEELVRVRHTEAECRPGLTRADAAEAPTRRAPTPAGPPRGRARGAGPGAGRRSAWRPRRGSADRAARARTRPPPACAGSGARGPPTWCPARRRARCGAARARGRTAACARPARAGARGGAAARRPRPPAAP